MQTNFKYDYHIVQTDACMHATVLHLLQSVLYCMQLRMNHCHNTDYVALVA